MDIIELHGERFKQFINEATILKKIEALSSQINQEYISKNPHFLVILTGAFMFGSEIIKRFQHPCVVDFIKIKSYSGMKSTGNVIIEDLDQLNLDDKDVIILEDLIDTGRTLSTIVSLIKETHPKSIRIVTLVLKENASMFDIVPDFIGFKVPNKFIIGYGTDYNGLGRNLPHIYIHEKNIM